MTILDKELEFSNKQAVTASAISTNIIDLGPNQPAGNSFGSNTEVPIIFSVEEAFAAAGAATLVVEVRSSEAEAMSSPVTHYRSAPIPVAALEVGGDLSPYLSDIRIPRLAKRYVGLYYTVATGPYTAGQISARGGTSYQSNR